MIQCKNCPLCQFDPDGKRVFKCDPFSNIKEPECLMKWQLIRLDMLTAAYSQMLNMQNKFAPLQDKLFKYMQREINEMDETEKWKLNDQLDNEDTDNDHKDQKDDSDFENCNF